MKRSLVIVSESAHMSKYQYWKVSISWLLCSKTAIVKTQFNTYIEFQDFMDQSGFSTKCKAKDDYTLIKGEWQFENLLYRMSESKRNFPAVVFTIFQDRNFNIVS